MLAATNVFHYYITLSEKNHSECKKMSILLQRAASDLRVVGAAAHRPVLLVILAVLFYAIVFMRGV